MALKTFVDSLDTLPEAVRGEYKETTDPKTKATVYVLDVEGPVEVLPAVRVLKDENARRRVEATAANDKLKKFEVLGDKDPTEILALLDKIPELEAAAGGKLDEAKISTIVEGRIKSKLAPLERERDQYKAQVVERDGIIQTFTAKEKTRLIGGAVSKAARELKVIDSAMEDIELYGDRLFEVQDDGAVVTKDNVGVTPGLSAKQWLEDMQGKRPHWWGPSAGGGAGGGRGGAGGAVNPWAAETWNMTEQSRLVVANPKRAGELAAAAGTTVGGRKPAAKK